MSERIAAVVCEGQTDFPILEQMIFELWPDVAEVRALQPELDEHGKARASAGWTAVKAWCEQRAGSLDELVAGSLIGDPIDLLIVAVDVDIAVDAGIADPPKAVGAYETSRLRDTITAWLRAGHSSRLPDAIVVSTPVRSIEAWVVAALFPQEKSAESIADPARYLVAKKKLRSGSDGKPWKELYLYRGKAGFGAKVAKALKRVRKLSEAERTCAAIEARRDAFGAKKKR